MEVIIIKQILGQIRSVIQEYDMIKENDKILVGYSGGKDSTTLLIELNKLKKFYPKKFEICAATVDMGLNNFNLDECKNLCEKLDINYTIENTVIGKVIFDIRKEKNPCSLCANFRRGALNNIAQRLGCNKVAVAHNKDDVIETLLLSLLYEGRIHTFSPVTYHSRSNIYQIRPLVYTYEHLIKTYIKTNTIKLAKNPCPYDKKTKREDIKNMIKSIDKNTNMIKSNIFGAIQRSKIDDWY